MTVPPLRMYRVRAAQQTHEWVPQWQLMVGRASTGWVVLGGNQGHPGDVSVTLFPSDGYEVMYRGMPNVQGIPRQAPPWPYFVSVE